MTLPLLDPNWTDPHKLADRDYLSGITEAIYAMTADGERGLYRSGVIGIQLAGNTAWKRLAQLRNGDLKDKGPWRFVFLAPLPGDLGRALGAAEKQLQASLAETFDVGRRGQFRTEDTALVQRVAGEATLAFRASMIRNDTADLEAALERYCAALADGASRDVDDRRAVLDALRMCLDAPLGRHLLDAVRMRKAA